MKILWKNHPSDPSKNGTTEHVDRTFAAVAIGYGQAEVVKYKNYVERLHDEQSRLPVTPVTVEWGVKPGDGSVYSKPYVIKKVGNETTFFSEPPADVPASIKARFEALTLPGVDPEQVKEHKVQEAYRQNEREQTEKKGVFKMLFGA